MSIINKLWVLIGLLACTHARLLQTNKLDAPIKGGVTAICPSLDKSSSACCYMHCEYCFTECGENEAYSDRQEDSDCAGRKDICLQECAVESTAPRNWGTHTC